MLLFILPPVTVYVAEPGAPRSPESAALCGLERTLQPVCPCRTDIFCPVDTDEPAAVSDTLHMSAEHRGPGRRPPSTPRIVTFVFLKFFLNGICSTQEVLKVLYCFRKHFTGMDIKG